MQFASPASASSSDSVGPADLAGHLCIFKPTEYKTDFDTVHGKSDVVVVDIADLDAGKEYSGVFFFGVAMRAALKPNIGAMVLGRIGQGAAKPGKSAPWVLVDATVNQADVDRATAHLAAKAAGSITAPAAAPAATVIPTAAINDPTVQALIAQLAGQQK